MINMDFLSLIAACMKMKQINQIQLAKLVNDSQGNLSKRMAAKDAKINDMIVKYLDAMGYDMEIRAIDRETGACIVVDNRSAGTEQEQNNNPAK